MRACVLGGAGFIGAALARHLVLAGWDVAVYDDLSTGHTITPGTWFTRYALEQHVTLTGYDVVYNLASPTGPRRVIDIPVKTILTNIVAARSALESSARVIQASTAEVYGNPTVFPQPETYTGNVEPASLKACYDESKRCSESLCVAYHHERGVSVGIARLFNVYGPGMAVDDGRVVPNMVKQAVRNEPVTLYGDGLQTRSFCYISDIVAGLVTLASSKEMGPFNLGNPVEINMRDLAATIIELAGSRSTIEYHAPTEGDSQRRCPDVARAKERLGWTPIVPLRKGLLRTIQAFKETHVN